MLVVTALFGLAALLYVVVPPLYTATAQILVDPRDRQVVTNDVNPSALGPDGGVTQVESQVRVIESDAVLTFGIICGSTLAFFQEYRRPTILSRRQFERPLSIPVLALLPVAGCRPTSEPPAAGPEVSAALDTLFAFHDVTHPPTALSLLVGGPPSETRASRNAIERFALAATERGERVLIVDTIAGNSTADPGLLEILSGDRLLGATVAADPATGVRRIGLGGPCRTPRSSIDKRILRRFLEESGRNFDLILFNSSAICNVLRFGSIVAAVDGILVVARCGQTYQDDLIEFAKSVAAMRRSVAAALLFDDRAAG